MDKRIGEKREQGMWLTSRRKGNVDKKVGEVREKERNKVERSNKRTLTQDLNQDAGRMTDKNTDRLAIK